MTTLKTAPRPWHHNDQGPTVGLIDNAGDPIGRIFDEDDAALIVSAVNAHDALVEVARAAKEFIATMPVNPSDFTDYYAKLDLMESAVSRLPEGTI